MTPALSVCIPTHGDWSDLLRQAVESVLEQLTPELTHRVEICISDNASTGGVPELVERLRARHPAIVYRRNERDMGAAYNILKSVAVANGDYCWLLSSDDAIVAGGIAHVLELLDATPDAAGLTVNRLNLDLELTAPVEQEPLEYLPREPERVHVFRTAQDAWLNCGMTFSYLSSQIADRRLWEEAVADPALQSLPGAEFFPYVAIIGLMLQRRPVWVWSPERLAGCRWGHSAATEMFGDARHVAPLFVAQQADLWARLLGRQSAAYRDLLRRAQPLWASGNSVQFYKSSSRHSAAKSLAMLVRLTRVFWRVPAYWREAVPLLALPGPLTSGGVGGRRSVALAPADCRVRIDCPPAKRLPAGRTTTLECIVTNLGRATLRSSPPYPVKLVTKWDQPALGPTRRTPLPSAIGPGSSVVVELELSTPLEPGEYVARLTAVQEQVAWFDELDPTSARVLEVEVFVE